MKVTETHARKGKFPLFKIDGNTINVKIRTINETEDWLEECEAIDDLEGKIDFVLDQKEKRTLQRQFRKAVYDAVFSYDTEMDRELVEANCTPKEIVEAYDCLKEELDPFVSRQKKAARESAELLSKLTPEMQNKALEILREKNSKQL